MKGLLSMGPTPSSFSCNAMWVFSVPWLMIEGCAQPTVTLNSTHKATYWVSENLVFIIMTFFSGIMVIQTFIYIVSIVGHCIQCCKRRKFIFNTSLFAEYFAFWGRTIVGIKLQSIPFLRLAKKKHPK